MKNRNAVFHPMALAWGCVLSLTACAPLLKRPCPDDVRVDFGEALSLARKAELAYLPDSVIQAACGGDSCLVVTGLTGARAFLQRDDSSRTQWIAFRGTQTVEDIRLDARYTQGRDATLGIYLHSGFAQAADDLLPLLLPRLKPDYRTILTGHSLGGAVAAVVELQLAARGFAVQAYTFGQPKVTNTEGARKYSSVDLVRFVNGHDLVPLVPPLDWKPGGKKIGSFEHFGREIALGDSSFECLSRHYARNVDPREWKEQAQAQAALDHLLANYLAKLTVLAR